MFNIPQSVAIDPSEPISDWGKKVLEVSAKTITPRYDQHPKGLVYPDPFEERDPLETPSGVPQDGILNLDPVIEPKVAHQWDGFTKANSPKALEKAGVVYHTFTGEGVVRTSRKFCSMSDPYEVTPLTDGKRGTFKN